MSQYIIDIKESKQADTLVCYLKSLDFIKIKPVNQAIAVGKSPKLKWKLAGIWLSYPIHCLMTT